MTDVGEAVDVEPDAMVESTDTASTTTKQES